MFIDQQNVRSLDKFSGQFSNEWRIVEQYLEPGIMTEASTCRDRFHRTFQTQSQHIGGNQCVRCLAHIVDRHLTIGTSRIYDGVLTIRIDSNYRGATGPSNSSDMRSIYTSIAQMFQQKICISVFAYRSEHLHLRSNSRSRRCLIR